MTICLEEFTGTPTVAGARTVPIRISPRELTTPGFDLGFLRVPSLTFTDVTVRIALVRAGKVTIPAQFATASAPAG